jgi:hypothetical protein
MFIGFDYYRVCVILYGLLVCFFVIYSYSPAMFETNVSYSQIKILVSRMMCIFFTCYVISFSYWYAIDKAFGKCLVKVN